VRRNIDSYTAVIWCGNGSTIDVWTASTGSKRCARRMRCASRDETEETAVTVETSGSSLLYEFEPRLVMAVQRFIDPLVRGADALLAVEF
jgi:hypothetical protein